MSYNSNVHSQTRYTPFELLFSNKMLLPTTTNLQPTYDSYLGNLKLQLNKSRELARDHLISNKHKSKMHYDDKIRIPAFLPGDYVLLKNEGNINKLQPLY